jgi:P27 family predicted phage terminase small subunit
MPPRKPASVRIAEGHAGHRPIPTEIDYPTGIKCPTFLDPEARKEWRRIASALADLDVLKQTDVSVLASYCVNFSRWKQAEMIIAKEGTTVRLMGSQGQERWVKHPSLTVAIEAQQQMLRSGKQLGFSPVDRVRVPSTPRQAANPFGHLDDGDDD